MRAGDEALAATGVGAAAAGSTAARGKRMPARPAPLFTKTTLLFFIDCVPGGEEFSFLVATNFQFRQMLGDGVLLGSIFRHRCKSEERVLVRLGLLAGDEPGSCKLRRLVGGHHALGEISAAPSLQRQA